MSTRIIEPTAAITARALTKRYGEVEALRGVDLEVRRGEIFAFLGPNGAGKTTALEILEGFRRPSTGEVSVLGIDPARGGRPPPQPARGVLPASPPPPR